MFVALPAVASGREAAEVAQEEVERAEETVVECLVEGLVENAAVAEREAGVWVAVAEMVVQTAEQSIPAHGVGGLEAAMEEAWEVLAKEVVVLAEEMAMAERRGVEAEQGAVMVMAAGGREVAMAAEGLLAGGRAAAAVGRVADSRRT